MNNNTFTVEEKENALAFAHAMGLPAKAVTEEENTNALQFAAAMGLRTPAAPKKKVRRFRNHILVPQFG